MFLPLLNESQTRTRGAELIGMKVYVWTSNTCATPT